MKFSFCDYSTVHYNSSPFHSSYVTDERIVPNLEGKNPKYKKKGMVPTSKKKQC